MNDKDKQAFRLHVRMVQKLCGIFLKLYPEFTAATCAKFLLHLHRNCDNFQDYMLAESNIGIEIGKWLKEEDRLVKIRTDNLNVNYVLPKGF